MSRAGRIAAVIVVSGALVAAYVWWNSPERQIRRVLAGVAERLSHDAPVQGLAAAAAAAGLQGYFAPDAIVEPGPRLPSLTGRDAIAGAAARLLVVTPTLQVEFVDLKISVADDRQSATIDCTALATTRDGAGQESADAREVMMTMSVLNGTWVITSAKALQVLEPVS